MGRMTEWVGDHPNVFASCGSTALIPSLVIGADDVGIVILSFAIIVLAFWLFCKTLRWASLLLPGTAAFILAGPLQPLLWALRAPHWEPLFERRQSRTSRGEKSVVNRESGAATTFPFRRSHAHR
jgi:hypothetical protein